VLSINPRAAVVLGVDPEAIIGASYLDLIPSAASNAPIREALLGAVQRSEPFDLPGSTWTNTRGQRIAVDLQGTVLAGEQSIISLIVGFGEVPDVGQVQRQVSRAHRLMIIGGFSAELAHEIRNPLSSVCGLVELLHERLPADDPGHRHLEVLGTAAGRIERLVAQLLDLVPTEMHDLERRDPSTVVRDAVAFARLGELQRQKVELIERYAGDLPDFMVDPDRISRAIENLVRNAYAHTPDDGTISVQTRSNAAGDIEIEVVNTGSYIPPERRGEIFQPFVSGRSNGTGLGLAIAQQIATAHAGTLRVESEPQGITAFVLCLPAAGEEPSMSPLSPPQPVLAAGVA